ncbi:hypothetical protein Godav_003637 [Gossypium davidsonii]|uniref:Uncharacterized protein n=1 Tax=Gossypium davidsonii TaxID=34287 RepID=A0A7J8SIJ1_GOSDV|nr:hypothetical protein [Gossypium davidsonii]
MLLHEKAVEALNPLAREFKSMGTMKKELTELQGELAQAHIQSMSSAPWFSERRSYPMYLPSLVRFEEVYSHSVSYFSEKERHILMNGLHTRYAFTDIQSIHVFNQFVKIEYLPYLCCVLTVAFEHLSLVKFLTPSSGLQGYWNHYPIDMEFRPQHIFTRFMYAITFINKENKTII